MTRIAVENAYQDLEYRSAENLPDAYPLNIISGGCHLYGYLLKPDGRYEKPHPTVLLFHGFPGYTTNNDLEYALMRMGCVVIHVNHRGAWGSEGNYLFSNLKDDAIAIAKWAHNPAIAEQYDIDSENIFLVGHSMGGMTVLNAARELPFVRGVAAIAPYDLDAAFQYGLEKELFFMIMTEGQCLKMTSVSDVYENAQAYRGQLALPATAEHLKEKNVLLIAATEDIVAPPTYMIEPLYQNLKASEKTTYLTLKTNHGLTGCRVTLSKEIGKWIASNIQ